ncbi:MAG: DUF4476 domain-containing protein [Bacteroidota bacterium]
MKKLLLLSIILVAFSYKMLAQSSDVTFFNQEGQKFYLIINGIKQNDTPQTNVKVSGLTADNYKAKVIFDNATIPAIDKTIYTRDVDGKFFSTSYIIKQDKNGNWVAKLNSMQENQVVYTNQYSQPLLLEERPIGTTVTTNQTTTTVNSNANNNGGGMNVSVVDPNTGQAVNMNVSVNANGMNTNAGINGSGVTSTTTTTTYTTTSSNGVVTNSNVNNAQGHYIMQGYNGNVGCPWPMSTNDFQSAINSISTKSFEDSKLTIAKQITSANCLFCSQVRDIMNLFSFESTKLDFAKFAFKYVYDQGNYFKLNDAFTFESSIDELNSYINGH